MLKRLEIGKLYRYIPTRAIAVCSGVEESGEIYKLIYLDDPDRVFNLNSKPNGYYNNGLSLFEEVRNDTNWDCYNSSLAC